MNGIKNGKVAALIFLAIQYGVNYLSYSLLLVVIMYTIVLLLACTLDTAFEHSVVALLSGSFKDVDVSLYGSNLQATADGKDVSRYASFILALIPVVLGLIYEFIRKLLHIKLNAWLCDAVLVFLWFVGSLIISVKLGNFIVPLTLLLMTTFCLLLFTYLKIVSSRIDCHFDSGK